MPEFPFDIVGFDLDGTLFDTSGDLTAAANHALALVGHPMLPVEAVIPMIGRGLQAMLQQVLAATGGYDPAEADRTYPKLLAYYEANIAATSAPYPGLLAAMDALDARGVKIAIVTNKLERLAVKLVEELGLTHRFATVIGRDTFGVGKPSPVPIQGMIDRCGGGRAAFVGDSDFDTAAARSAGIPSVVVGFGFLTQPAEALGGDAVIDHYDALIPALEKLGR
jgi:phosphoglycolate phosphatase